MDPLDRRRHTREAREATEVGDTFVVLPGVDAEPVTVFADGSYVRGWSPGAFIESR